MFRESTEWSQLYWFNTEAANLPRIMLIGDSIVAGHAPVLAQMLAGKATVAYFATSRIVGDPAYYRELAAAVTDMHLDLIEFNNGLHGFKYDTAFYRAGLAMTLDQLQTSVRCPIRWRSSTPITVKNKPDELAENNQTVIERNQAARELMDSRNIPTDDMYSLMLNHPEWSSGDGYHFNDEGRSVQAKILAEILLTALAGRKTC